MDERAQESIEKAVDALLAAWQERGEEAAPKAWYSLGFTLLLLVFWTLA